MIQDERANTDKQLKGQIEGLKVIALEETLRLEIKALGLELRAEFDGHKAQYASSLQEYKAGAIMKRWRATVA